MSEEEKQSPPSKKVTKKRINIHLPKDLEPTYANVAFISHSLAELVIDFAQVLPRSPRGSVKARIIMTPMHAKMLQLALAQNLTNYENQYGKIRLPQRGSNLADKFFEFPQEDAEDDKKDES